MLQKQLLREKILAERRSFDIYKFEVENEAIIRNVKLVIDSLYRNFKSDVKKIIKLEGHELEVFNSDYALGLYLPLAGEPDLTKIMLYTDSALCLPKMDNDQIKYVNYQLGAALEKSDKQFQQPVSDVEVVPKVIIVPGLAFSIKGYRLGFGRGHYDQYLKKHHQSYIKIGVCFDDYLHEYIPNEAHDIKFDYIITDKTILKL